MTTSSLLRRAALAAVLTAGALAGCSDPGAGLGGDDAPPDAPPPEPWVDPGTAEELFGPDLITDLELVIAPDDIARLEANPREYVPATINYQGGSFGPVGVRLKGVDSFLPIGQKPSFRVNVNEYIPDATFWGLKDLTFNNMKSDWSMMHDRLAYKVAREAGLVASRANHLVLTVNGQPYGLYSHVETIKERMISNHFDDSEGSLFEATDVDFQPQFVNRYELKAGPDDRSMISGLVNALALPDATQAIAAASAYVDIAHFQRFWAMETVIAQYDAFPYSLPGDDYFLYADPTTGKLWFIPWGMDETFLSAEFDPFRTNSVLAKRCQEAPACRQGYIDQVWQVLGIVEANGWDAERVRLTELLAPHIAADTRKPYSAQQVQEGQTQLRYFIRNRRATLTAMFNPTPPPGP